VEISSNAETRAKAVECGPGLREGPGRPGALVREGETQGTALARILGSAAVAFVSIDFEGRIVSTNRAFAEIAGTAPEDLINRLISEITPAVWREPQAKALERVRSTAKSIRFEAECLRLDGSLVPIEVAAEPDRDALGEVAGVFAFVTDLTERKRSDGAMRESEERFRRLYDEAPVGYHEVDTEGRVVSMNLTECELLGIPREDVLGRPVFDFLAEEIRESSRQVFAEKISGLLPLKTFERTYLTGDGRRLVMQIEDRLRRDDAGRVVGLLSTVQDVTDRKRAEAALQGSERRARALFEGIEEAVFVHALDGRILDANPAAIRLLGYSRDEFLSLTTADIDDPSFAAGYEDRLARQMANGHLSCEGRHRTRDGRVIPVEISTSAIQLDDQKAVLAVIRDISERLTLEDTRVAFAEAQSRNALEMAAKNAELILSEARYRQLTEGCLDGVVVADRFGLVTLYNPAAERMFGYPAGEVMGRPIRVLFPGTFSDGEGRTFVEDVLEREPGLVGKTVELLGRRNGGEDFPLELSLSSVDRGGELQFIGSVRDQTERHRMRAMLTQTEKLASMGLLLSGVAHEINNPLAYVGNNIAVLERDMTSVLEMIALYEATHPDLEAVAPEALRGLLALAEDFDWPYVRENLPRMLTRTREGVQRVANIVANLRGLARTSPPTMETVRVPDLLEGALEMVRGRLRRSRIEISIEHGDVPPVTCVPAQISQVILNLLVNATQAVEATNPPDGGKIRFTSAVVGPAVALSIIDNGCGIEPDSFHRLFDPFYTTKSVGEGTGLGLSICHGIVTGHNGRIEVESRLGEGTTFRILLPLSTP